MTVFEAVDARGVANLLLVKGQAEDINLDLMKLLKLTYIAHGWVLGLTERPLFREQVLAWPYGPVIREVYNAFRNFGASAVTSPASCSIGLKWRPIEAELTSEVSEIVQDVWDEYKSFTGLQLSTLTHKPRTPWAQVTAGKEEAQIRDILIPNELIRDHYRTLAQRAVNV